MTTVGDVVDRVLRDALYGADDQPISSVLASSMTDVGVSLTYDADALSVEEEGALTAGVIVEVGQEQMRVREFVASGSLVVARGANGTDAVAHTAGDVVTIAPTFARRSVFDAVADAITRLSPALWRQAMVEVSAAAPYAVLPSWVDSVQQVRYRSGTSMCNVGWEFLSDIDTDGGVGVAVYDVGAGEQVEVICRGGFDRPTAESDTFADLGLRDDWQRVVVIDAVAHILSGSVEIGRATQNWLTEELSNTAYPPLNTARLAAQLDQYRKMVLRDLSKALHSRDRTSIRRRSPFFRVPTW